MPSSGAESEHSKWLFDALRAVFAPLVRMLLGRVSYRACADLLLEAYITEGRRFLEESDDRKPTKSELSLLAGIDHRAIDKFLVDRNERLSLQKMCPETEILERWKGDPEFLADDGNPRALVPAGGRGATFQHLVLRVAGRSVSYHSLLDRFLDERVVEMQPDGLVKPLSFIYPIPRSGSAGQLRAGLVTLARVGSVVAHNVGKPPASPGVFEQRRWSVRVRPCDLVALREEARKLSMQQIEEGTALLERYEQPVDSEGDHFTYGLGWYHWHPGILEPDDEGE